MAPLPEKPLIGTEQLALIDGLPPEDKAELLGIVEEIEHATEMRYARGSFMGYVKHMWPEFIEGKHHHKMAEARILI